MIKEKLFFFLILICLFKLIFLSKNKKENFSLPLNFNDLKEIDLDGDGQFSIGELDKATKNIYSNMLKGIDKDGNGFINETEYENFLEKISLMHFYPQFASKRNNSISIENFIPLEPDYTVDIIVKSSQGHVFLSEGESIKKTSENKSLFSSSFIVKNENGVEIQTGNTNFGLPLLFIKGIQSNEDYNDITQKSPKIYISMGNEFKDEEHDYLIHFHKQLFETTKHDGVSYINSFGHQNSPNGEKSVSITDSVIRLPAGGSHWYHSHTHHTTQMEVLRGMAGLIIIQNNEDPYDTFIPSNIGVNDFYVKLSNISIDGKKLVENEYQGSIIMVNDFEAGVIRNQFVPINEYIRIRFLNGSVYDQLYNIKSDKKFILISKDGHFLKEPETHNYLSIPLGSRMDIISEKLNHGEKQTFYSDDNILFTLEGSKDINTNYKSNEQLITEYTKDTIYDPYPNININDNDDYPVRKIVNDYDSKLEVFIFYITCFKKEEVGVALRKYDKGHMKEEMSSYLLRIHKSNGSSIDIDIRDDDSKIYNGDDINEEFYTLENFETHINEVFLKHDDLKNKLKVEYKLTEHKEVGNVCVCKITFNDQEITKISGSPGTMSLFGWGRKEPNSMRYYINNKNTENIMGRKFSESVYIFCVENDSTEIWDLEDYISYHPLHIHQKGAKNLKGIIKDTFDPGNNDHDKRLLVHHWVPEKTSDGVNNQKRNAVMVHCHVLRHHDHGMMIQYCITPK